LFFHWPLYCLQPVLTFALQSIFLFCHSFNYCHSSETYQLLVFSLILLPLCFHCHIALSCSVILFIILFEVHF
jgi:hypothetical protein